MDDFTVPLDEPSPEFLSMWQAAGRHLQNLLGGDFCGWLNVEPRPPFLDHLSFRVGNQVFFVRCEDVDGHTEVPGARRGLLAIAEGWQGYPCLLPMEKNGDGWRSTESGWGLIDLRDKRKIDPVALATDEDVEVTEWELLDFAVQVVKTHIADDGHQLMSSNSNPSVHPNIWFVRDGNPEWVMVRAVRYPDRSAEVPGNWESVARDCAHLSRLGNFAVVAFSSNEDPRLPILRGHAADVLFEGLMRLPTSG